VRRQVASGTIVADAHGFGNAINSDEVGRHSRRLIVTNGLHPPSTPAQTESGAMRDPATGDDYQMIVATPMIRAQTPPLTIAAKTAVS
jgi:hypothetical protein